jgi:YbbR domain-containing protein
MRAWLAGLLSERSRLFLLSLVIAVAMWSYVGAVLHPEPRTATASLLVRNVEVTFTGLADGWKAVALPRAVDIEIRGPASLLAVRAADARAIADLGALDPGAHQVTLRIQIPGGVTMVKATPPAVYVTVGRP